VDLLKLFFFKEKLSSYPDACIFYRSDLFNVVDHGVYWLGPRPDVPFSGGFVNKTTVPRLVDWAHFRSIATNQDFLFMTTHFDNNYPNQVFSANLVLERTLPWARAMPVIFLGDYNSSNKSLAYTTLIRTGYNDFKFIDTHDIAHKTIFDTNIVPKPDFNDADSIDHILVGGNYQWNVTVWTADQYIYGPNKRQPSDHITYIASISVHT